MSLAESDIRGVDLSPGLTSTERIEIFLKNDIGRKLDYNGFDKDMIKNDLKLVSASPGEVVFELTVKAAHTNLLGVMHGGCVATVFDICTGVALIPGAKEGFWQFPGLTRSLNVTYFRPSPKGAEIVITSTVVRAGKNLATIRGVITDKVDGKVCSTADHLKFNDGAAESKL